MTERIDYKVEGLDCAEEVAVLKREVGRLDGVVELDFDVLNAKMTIVYDPALCETDNFIGAISRTGMKAIPWSQREAVKEGSRLQRYGRLFLTIISGCSLVAGYLYHAILHGFLNAFTGGDKVSAFPEISLILYITAIITGGFYIFPRAVYALRRLRPDMNLLMTIAVFGAMLIQEWFEAATVTFLFAVALFLEQWSVERARRAISAVLDLAPNFAHLRDKEGQIRDKLVAEVPVNSVILVRPGEKIPLDGIVTKGTSTVNQAPITGESMPIKKEPGDEVYAGTLNSEGTFEFRADKPAEDTVLARIIHMIEEAQSRRAPSQQWVEKFSLYYTPVMLFLAIALAIIPPLIIGSGWTNWFYQALVLLVIACPCALVIATPVSIVSGLTTAARHGILIKGGVYLELAGQLEVLAIDKTGTLTMGHPEVQKVIALNDHSEDEVLELAAGLETASEHPIARAVLRKAHEKKLSIPVVENFRAVSGKGGQGNIAGVQYWIGNHKFMEEKKGETDWVDKKITEMEDAGHTVVALGNDRHVCGLISVADEVRSDAATAIQLLHKAGIQHIVMLTGDNAGTAEQVAKVVGIDDYRPELLPEDKVAAIHDLREQYNIVAMVGDGINDAPSMASANFGIAMGVMGTDAAIETADIALMADDLLKLSWLMSHSRRTLSIIKTNIAFALGLKTIFVILTLFGVASLWMAIAADTGATLLVVFNSLRLLHDSNAG